MKDVTKKNNVASIGGVKSQFYVHMFLFFNIQELQCIDLVLQCNNSRHYEALSHTSASPVVASHISLYTW